MALVLGKKPYKHDKRTLEIGPLLTLPKIPSGYDFDSHRVPFPRSSWGNNSWGNCVKGGQCNQTIRFERAERRVTLPITEKDVVEEYKKEVERQFGHRPASPGDQYDEGLVMLDNLVDWRNVGWDVPLSDKKRYINRIEAFGKLNPEDSNQIEAAIYLLRGVQFGLNLPRTAQRQFSQERHWYVESGPGSEPGSWGGHCVYSKRYGPKGLYVITWGEEILVDWDFLAKYCDEAWAVVDKLDDALIKRYLDVDAMMQHLHDVGAS